jgi:GTP-binding protein
MIVGEHSREGDLEVNPAKMKVLSCPCFPMKSQDIICQHVTNIRSVQKEEFVRLTPPKRFSLEETMAYCRGSFFLIPC